MQPDSYAEKIANALKAAKTFYRAGRLDDSRRACMLILQLEPWHPGALQRLALIARQQGQADKAIQLLSDLIARHPKDAAAIRLLSAIWREAGQPERSEALLDAVMPGLAEDAALLLEKAQCRIDRQDVPGAIPLLQRAVALAPENPDAHTLLGIALRRTGDRASARDAFNKAVSLNPQDANALNGLGNDCLEKERFPEAAAYYRRAVAVRPAFLKAHKNLAYTLNLDNDVDGAKAAFARLFELAPDFHEGHMDYGLFLLSLGDYVAGWREYEHRWSFPGFTEPNWGGGLPRWDGSPLAGRHLLLWGEQGVGDHVLYGTMLPDVARRAAGRVTLAVEARLVSLFARSLADDGIGVVTRGEQVQADVQCPLGSLGTWLRHSPRECGSGRYLRADGNRVEAIRRRYAERWPTVKRRIGLSWRSTNWHVGDYKSLDLETLLPVLRKPDIAWVSLQYGRVEDEIAAFTQRHGIEVHQDSEIDPTNDLDGLAAQIAALDGVASISNSTVHFAGALGKPCWVLLPAGRGRMWYWPREGERTPWYDSIRLLRQSRPGDWSGVLDRLGEVLDAAF
ncbi:MAG: tetratricopeptide repeat protein [Ferrovibrio sp.]|uniref:tetratricopeptide repeat protein n=1 Tax=Ferrovibrio sp. TaxID=1917215 RepID=UPI00391CCF18